MPGLYIARRTADQTVSLPGAGGNVAIVGDGDFGDFF
jgi:hypothetical protein